MAFDVVVAGSLHFDILVAAERLPRTGETFPGSAWAEKCGGKGGNQAIESARHGAATAMIGRIGHDGFGSRLLAKLDASGVDTSMVERIGLPSGMSVAISDPAGDYGAIIVTGANAGLAETDMAAALGTLGGRVLVLQNEIPETANLAAARAAKAGGARVLLNAAPARMMAPELLGLVDVLIVNAIEAEMLGSAPVTTLDTAAQAAAFLMLTVPTVIVTAGGDGLAFASPYGSGVMAAHPVALVSTHGAGDAMVGALAARLAAGAELEPALRYANAAAAVLVSATEAARDALSADETLALLACGFSAPPG